MYPILFHDMTKKLDVVADAFLLQPSRRQAPLLSAEERLLGALQRSENMTADSLLIT